MESRGTWCMLEQISAQFSHIIVKSENYLSLANKALTIATKVV